MIPRQRLKNGSSVSVHCESSQNSIQAIFHLTRSLLVRTLPKGVFTLTKTEMKMSCMKLYRSVHTDQDKLTIEFHGVCIGLSVGLNQCEWSMKCRTHFCQPTQQIGVCIGVRQCELTINPSVWLQTKGGGPGWGVEFGAEFHTEGVPERDQRPQEENQRAEGEDRCPQ